MKKLCQLLCAFLALLGCTLVSQATVVVNQTAWPDGDFSILQTNQNLPYSLGWQISRKANYWGTNGTMVESNLLSGTAFYAYIAGPANAISLTNGEMIRATFNVTFSNVVPQSTMLGDPTGRGLRFGFVCAGTNQFPLTNGTGSSLRCQPGYSQNMNFATAFTMDGPLQTLAWTNATPITEPITGNGLFEKAADNLPFGDNGGGHSNDTAFVDATNYTFIFTVAHTDTNTVNITTTIVGSTLTNGFITQSVTDTNYAYTNFDTFGIRPATSSRTAVLFTFSSFKVETLPILPTAPQMTKAQKQGTNWVITWNSTPGYTYSVLKTNNLAGGFANWTTLATGYPGGYATGSSLSYTDTTASAGVTVNYYRVSTPTLPGY